MPQGLRSMPAITGNMGKLGVWRLRYNLTFHNRNTAGHIVSSIRGQETQLPVLLSLTPFVLFVYLRATASIHKFLSSVSSTKEEEGAKWERCLM